MIYQIAVIGAGSAGILALSELLTSFDRIAWVDPEFNCGALQHYLHIPSNTKVGIQVKVANLSSWFQQHPDNIVEVFQGLDHSKTSALGSSYHMFQRMTKVLDETASHAITKFKAEAVEYLQQADNTWKVSLSNGQQFVAKEIVFCVGGHNRDLRKLMPQPFDANPHLINMELMDAMCPKRAPHKFTSADTVSIIGGSHSGYLALMTLYQLPNRPKKLYLFHLNEAYFAEHLESGEIKYDYIGLKGDVADFTKQILTTRPQDIEFIESNDANMLRIFPQCNKVVTAVGFERNRFGRIVLRDGTTINDNQVYYDPCMANLTYNGKEIDGLYGGGIAFPEKKVDVCGLPDCAVGFYKHMNYMQKLVQSGILRPKL